MYRRYFLCMIVTVCLFSLLAFVQAQEFPVAAGNDTTFSGGAVYGGLNGLVAVCGDSTSQYSITAQMVGVTGTNGHLIGSRISLGAYGVPPGAAPVFDGTNYILVWRDFSSTLQGQIINTAGALVGTAFPIAANVSLQQKHTHQVFFSDSSIFTVYVKNDGYLYAQRVRTSGSLLGSEIQIAASPARDFSVSFDGTNYLVVWVDDIADKNIYGQFVSTSGTLAGSAFLIDGGSNYSDNPTAIAFDGTRYLMVYHDAPTLSAAWTIMGCFITTSGSVAAPFTICDSTWHPAFPSIAFDHVNYLISWSQSSNNSQMGRFYAPSGSPVETAFSVFGPSGNKVPMGGIGFGGGLYLAVTTKMNASFSDGDVYGRFIQPVTTGVHERTGLAPETSVLFQNYPNPFNPSTTISFHLSSRSFVSLKVFDALGREVSNLVTGELPAGDYARQWNAGGAASGMYFYRLQTGTSAQTKKLMVIK